jgi:2-(1,2-epoxy-1,2-dihydrophenyl)acetyl-CoA isomerase
VTHDDRIRLTVTDGVAEIRLTRPDAHNAIDPAWIHALADVVQRVENDQETRAVLITADGPSFTVGGDLKHFRAHLDDMAAELETMIRPFHDALERLASLPVPVVTAAQGAAAGGGLGLLWLADVVIAADDLKIATGFARIGLTGDGGSSWWLPRLVCMRRARELIIGGRVLDAEEALDWGLVSRVVPAADLAAAGAAEAARLAAGPKLAYGRMRELLLRSTASTLDEQLAAEREAMRASGATADAREGISSFVERRDPDFTGA